MKRVYADMVGDLFHAGHVAFLRAASGLGDELVVGVHGDDAVAAYKRRPIQTLAERVAVIEACRWVTCVVPGAPIRVSPELLDQHHIDVVVHGSDFDAQMLQYCYAEALSRGILHIVPYTLGISTTDLLQRVGRACLTSGEEMRACHDFEGP